LEERLQKVLAKAGVCSRRAAEDLIRQGRVTVDGQSAHLGQRADPARADIRLDGRPLGSVQAKAVYLFHKPKGVVTTLDDPQHRPCLKEHVSHLPERVFPVGRLDQDASGLLILTNDGDLTQRLIHPSHKVDKTYLVKVRGRADEAALASLRSGVLIGDRPSAPAQVKLIRHWPKGALLRLTIHEGRHHQVKRMCGQVGLRVEELSRIRVGPLDLKDLGPGEIRRLSQAQTARLKKKVGLK